MICVQDGASPALHQKMPFFTRPQAAATCLNTKHRSDDAVKDEAFVRMCRKASLTA
ncbi:MAG: hypothetical protein IKE94_01995 [Aeriscardovia sp.]|nr:hypothetical protein [Aeriscardovia sp.]